MKKILALILSVMMIFGCLGFTGLAADDDVIIDDDDIIIEDDDVIIDDDDIVDDEGDEDDEITDEDIVDENETFTGVLELVNMVVTYLYNLISEQVQLELTIEQVLNAAKVIAKLVYTIVAANI